MQAPHWTVCVYAGNKRSDITAEELAAFDIVLATPHTMRRDSPLCIQKSLHEWASFLLMFLERRYVAGGDSISQCEALEVDFMPKSVSLSA